MKKAIFHPILAAILFTGLSLQSQNNSFPSNGNAGVGTTNPSEKFEVNGNLSVIDTVKTKHINSTGGLRLINLADEGHVDFDRIVGVTPNGTLKTWNTIKVGTPAYLLDLNGNFNVTGNTKLNRLEVYRITALAGDTIVRLGDSTVYFYSYKPGIGWTADGNNKGFVLGNSTARGVNSICIGNGSAVGLDADNSYAFGNLAGINANTVNSIVIGSGLSVFSRFVNSIPNSIMFGMNSTIPTLFISPSNGVNTTGVVCVATTQIPTGSQYKLAVNGTILATEVEVKAFPWPDYVFDKSYQLMSLSERNKFLQENRHMPWMPSAKQIEGEGLGVSQVLKGITRNTEELTLYILQQQNEIELLKKKLAELEQVLMPNTQK